MNQSSAFSLTTAITRGSDIGAGRRLLEAGALTTEQFLAARRLLPNWNATLTDILIAQGVVKEAQVLVALAAEHHTQVVNLTLAQPDFRLQTILPPEACLKHCAIPWALVDGKLLIAARRIEDFETVRNALPERFRNCDFVFAPETQIQAMIARFHRKTLTEACETRVALDLSSRSWAVGTTSRAAYLMLCVMGLIAGFRHWPLLTLQFLLALTLLFLVLGSAMKLIAYAASSQRSAVAAPDPDPEKLPKISVLVPLYKEKEIASALIRRLKRLTYPRALLDVVLVLEEKDRLTQDTIAETELPRWMRVVCVPEGSGLTTKPRAMNFALDFCRGDIIGIWDAEDAPDPGQLEAIAAHFANAAPDVACVQGILDYYNPDTNWISRCFTMEYSLWFRITLRGMSALGSPVPLGGTTLFMRRDVLEEIGRWDAHNVTEDADLGIRLTRFGYRTELSRTVTQEEANCHFKPWIRQRSRWLKGYMVTYLVHMRRPGLLMKQIGLARFIGLNVILLAALMQFLLAPVLWCFWLVFFGLPDPLGLNAMPPIFIQKSMIMLGLAMLTDIALAAVSLRGQNRRHLVPWSLTFLCYFPMATLAAYKALFELVFVPFYWDKTAHGLTQEGQAAEFSAVST